MLHRLFAVVALLVSLPLFAAATRGGAVPVPLPLFPANNWWNVDISNAPIDPNSAAFINFVGATRGLHPDFGGDAGGGDVYGFPYIIVDGAQAKKTVNFMLYGDESDGVGVPFYPVPDEAITQSGWIEGGQPGNVDQRNDADRHILIVDRDHNHLYELYNVWWNGTRWEAGSGAFFDMNTNNRRPEGWTSTDAAGLAILPGLVRYDEAFGEDEIRHAFRVTVRATNGHVFPASHTAGSTSGALPMGARLRLKASKNISSYSPEVQKIFRAMKKYGLIVADNGSDMYVSGAYDTRWNNDVLNPAFAALKASDFEVVQRGWSPSVSLVLALPSNAGSSDATTATLTAYDANYAVATGYTGTVQFTATDGAATLPMSYTFTAADQGTHTFPSGFIFRTPGTQIVTVTDAANATITGSDAVVVGASTPSNLVATATTTTQVSLTWNPSSGATQYEVYRNGALRTTTSSASFTDTNVVAGTSYVYRVRALDSSSRASAFSTPDAATTMLFTQGTRIAAVHITELRQAVNALRAAASLPAATFTDATLVRVKRVHIAELRSALDAARAALELPPISYTDPLLGVGTVARLMHVQQLRDGVR